VSRSKVDGEIITARLARAQVEAANKILNGEHIEGFAPECMNDPDVWFPDDDKRSSRALPKRICGGCPLRDACLEAVMTMEGGRRASSRYGVWGGLDERERETLARRRREARR
jgi:WhiB family redox-sensing transcriptional regulator